uniref:Uncharacterized protein n=1 Tax=Physcomitrium patens TaxID=3218 RepID=A0A7I4BNS8_PHYPA
MTWDAAPMSENPSKSVLLLRDLPRKTCIISASSLRPSKRAIACTFWKVQFIVKLPERFLLNASPW